MIDPGTAMLIATAFATAAKGGGEAMANRAQQKAAKRRAKETKRETRAGLLQDTLQRGAELEGQRLQGRKNLGKSKVKGHLDTAEVVRGALNI